jgi:UDP-N-acetyl-D-galactosamine dehydrogenase
MTQFVIESMMKLLITNKIETTHLIIGVFGVSYKKNVPDIRNSLSLKLIKELEAYDIKILVHDPFNHKIIVNDHELPLSNFDDMQDLSVAIVSVAHDFYKKNLKEMLNKCKHPSVLMDIPNLFINDTKNHQGLIYWNL